MLSKLDDVMLLRYSEDDLSGDERLAVEVALAQDDAAQAELRMLVLTSGILRDSFMGFDRRLDAGLAAEKIENDQSSDDGSLGHPATVSARNAPAESVDTSPHPSPQAMEPEYLQNKSPPAPATAAPATRKTRPGRSRRQKRSVLGLFILLAAEVALAVVGVGLYFYFLSPTENEPGPVARTSPSQTESADLPPEPKPPRVGQLAFQDIVDRMPIDWNRQVFESEVGDVKTFALLNGGSVTFKVGEAISTPGRPPCRETVVDVTGPQMVTLRMQVCQPRDGVW